MLAVAAGGFRVLRRRPRQGPGGFETKAKHAILMDADADLIFYEKDPDTLMPPASMSKLMTLALVFRELKAGRIKLEDQFKVSEHAWRTGGAPSGGSAMFAPLNSMVSVSDSSRAPPCNQATTPASSSPRGSPAPRKPSSRR